MTTARKISTRVLTILGATVVLTILAFVLTPFLSHRSRGERIITYHHLRACYMFLEAIEAETGHTINSELFSNPTNPPHLVFLRLLEQYTNTYGGHFNTNLILDGWQRPLLFTNDLAPTPWLRIWSAGPNGSNKLGSGDDIGYNYDKQLLAK